MALALSLAAAGIWMLGDGARAIAITLLRAEVARSNGPIPYGARLPHLAGALSQAEQSARWVVLTAERESSARLCERLATAFRANPVSLLLVHARQSPSEARVANCVPAVSGARAASPFRYAERGSRALLGADALKEGGFALTDSSLRVVYSSVDIADIARLPGVLWLFAHDSEGAPAARPRPGREGA